MILLKKMILFVLEKLKKMILKMLTKPFYYPTTIIFWW